MFYQHSLSPDLNPNEFLWQASGNKNPTKNITNKEYLWQKEWAHISVEVYCKFVYPMNNVEKLLSKMIMLPNIKYINYSQVCFSFIMYFNGKLFITNITNKSCEIKNKLKFFPHL